MRTPAESEATRTTTRPDLDAALTRLRDRGAHFARASIGERLTLLRRMLLGYHAVAEESVRAGCHHKGLDFDSPAAGEEWLAGPMVVLRSLRLYIDTLERLQAGGAAVPRERVHTRRGRSVVDVFPYGFYDKLLFAGLRGEVWMKPGMSESEVVSASGAHYQIPTEQREGKVALVLGAGNVASIPSMDVMYKLFVEGKVCVLKMNPVNAHVGPFIERAFACLVEAGYLRVVYGGAEVGGYLADHPLVDEIHITGSDKTHDLLVWGPPGSEREARKVRREPLLKKEITSELGCVTPVIVVPGPYTDDELAFQGDNIGAGVANNASFNCNSFKLLVGAKGWDRHDRLMSAIAGSLSQSPVRQAYYPGAEERWRLLVESHKSVEQVGADVQGALKWALIRDLDPSDQHERCYSMEPWCSVLSEVSIGSTDPVAFLKEAVRFVNERVWGTLSATLIVHPKTAADPEVTDALEQAIGDLRYGAVAVNQWPGMVYGLGTLPWGGHPSVALEDIQSGRGFVHNSFMLEGIEKAVLRGPLVARPKPPFFVSHRTAHVLGRRLVGLESRRSPFKLPGIFLAALRG